MAKIRYKHCGVLNLGLLVSLGLGGSPYLLDVFIGEREAQPPSSLWLCMHDFCSTVVSKQSET